MTGLLKDLLTERADGVPAPVLDVDAVMRTGDRRIRRRRVASALTVAAVTAAVLAGGVTAVRDVTDGRRVEQIGAGNQAVHLTADTGGTLVGWVDARPTAPEFVLYDVAARREVARTGQGNRPTSAIAPADPPRISAIDDGYAYFGAWDGLRRWNVATGTGELIKPKAHPKLIQTVATGHYLWSRRAANGDTHLAVAKDIDTPRPRTFVAQHGSLAPDGRSLVTIGDTTKLVPVRRPTGGDAVLRLLRRSAEPVAVARFAPHPAAGATYVLPRGSRSD